MRVPPTERRRARPRFRPWMAVLLVVLAVVAVSLRGLAGFYTDFLWFESIGFAGTWRRLLYARVVPAAVFAVVFFVLMWASLTIADRLAPALRTSGPEDELLDRYHRAVGRYSGRIRVAVALFFGLVAGGTVSTQWRNWILFTNRVDFGVRDPEFGRDVGFYVFQLPFLKFIVDWTFAGLVIVFVVTTVAHYLNGGIRIQSPYQRVTPQVKAHLSVILALMALTKGVGYYLAQFELTLAKRGVVEGATYTSVHADLQALRLLIAIAVIAAALFVWNIFRRGWVLPVIAVGLWGLLSLVVGTIYPAFVQKFRVEPNELTRERPYIKRNIDATRRAWNLDGVKAERFDYKTNLDAEALRANSGTIDNARLWDVGELLANYRQQQAFGTFYRFADVDVDRYRIGGTQVQVMVSARELNRDDLPNQSWVARHLTYTHGYGMAVSPSNAVDSGGQPAYVLSDIPVSTEEASLRIERPEVYYGEAIGGFSLVDGRTPEFDHPRKGRGDATTRYEGKGGVELSSWLRRFSFALRFGDFNTMISSQVTRGTRILFQRDVASRVASAAPFLDFDSDPYPVILDGRILWVLDGYTSTDRYPYAQSFAGEGGIDGTVNYVRNSVKATVDAYDGTVRFYAIDDDDPVLSAYRKAFPGLFTPGDRMPDGLRDHLRYPEDLFTMQTNVFETYHMTDAATFYNKTDRWAVSPDPGSGVVQLQDFGEQADTTTSTDRPQAARSTGRRIEPIYMLIRLPGETREQFLMIRPFVPVSKDNALNNLVSFMTASSDPADYGRLRVYEMPSGETVPGPPQVDNTIRTTEQISQRFTLLGTQGSTVIQGSLQLIPVNDSILYIRPVYVQASSGPRIPSFRFVVVVYGDRAVIGDNLADALARIPEISGPGGPSEPTGPGGPTTTTTTPTTSTTGPGTPATTAPGEPPSAGDVGRLLDEAAAAYADAQDALKEGDWARYGELMDRVGRLIAQAREAAGTSG